MTAQWLLQALSALLRCSDSRYCLVREQSFAVCITYTAQRLGVTAEMCFACLAGHSSWESEGCKLETRKNKATPPWEESRIQKLLAASAARCWVMIWMWCNRAPPKKLLSLLHRQVSWGRGWCPVSPTPHLLLLPSAPLHGRGVDATRAGRADRCTCLTLAAGSLFFFGPHKTLMFRLSHFQEFV